MAWRLHTIYEGSVEGLSCYRTLVNWVKWFQGGNYRRNVSAKITYKSDRHATQFAQWYALVLRTRLHKVQAGVH